MSNTISVTVTGESVGEVLGNLEKMALVLGAKGESVATAPAADAAVTAAAPAKKGPGRPPKTAAETPKAAEAPKAAEILTTIPTTISTTAEVDPFDTGAGAPTEKVYTSQDAFAALQAVNAKKNLVGVQEVLAQFKCARLSELKAEDYAGFVKACEKAAA